VIATGGLQVFPRLIAAESRGHADRGTASTGLETFDRLLGGGLDRGASTLFIGPAGSGKSAIATQVAVTAADRGEHVAIYLFDEGLDTFRRRAAGLGADVERHLSSGQVVLTQVDPAELSPGEFADQIRSAVDRDHASVVVIDSLNGYLNAMPDDKFLSAQLHELLSYLNNRGVATFLVTAQSGMMGMNMRSPVDTSYLADGVVMMRMFEHAGKVKKAISTLKKRSGPHEESIRQIWFDGAGIHLSEPLANLRGVLSGVPIELGSGHQQKPERAFVDAS